MIRKLLCTALVVAGLLGPAQAEDTPDLAALLGRQLFIEGKQDEAFAAVKPLAEQGVPRAQNLLGYFYDFGIGVAADPALAVEWYAKSADQGHAPAQFNMGSLYELGLRGLSQDAAKAREYYALAVAQDYQPALNNLAQLYYNGIGGEKDEALARALIERAVALGNKDAIANLAYRLATGDGAEIDLERARALYLIAAAHLIPWAARDYGEMQELGEGGPVDLEEAEDWYVRAVGLGNAMAAMDMTEMIWANGAAMPDRQVEALAWCFKAEALSPDADGNDYNGRCDETAAKVTPEDLAKAREMAAGL